MKNWKVGNRQQATANRGRWQVEYFQLLLIFPDTIFNTVACYLVPVPYIKGGKINVYQSL